MPANDRMPTPWSRRSLLLALVVGSATALSGCAVQLEEGAPRIPLVPTRVAMKDERALLVILGRTTSLGSLARSVGGTPTSMASRLSELHAAQVAVFTRLLRDGGVPESLISSSTTPGPASPGLTTPPAGATPTPTTAASPNRTGQSLAPAAELSAAESASVGDVSVAALSNAHVALIGSMLAQRLACVTLLGGSAVPTPAPESLDGAAVVPLLQAARATVYGFEVVAAQIDPAGRALALSTLAWVRAQASQLQTLAGASAPLPPLGYEMPFPVLDGASARRLALHLLTTLLTSQAATLGPATGQAAALDAIVHWLAAAQVTAFRWGARLTGFPGLADA